MEHIEERKTVIDNFLKAAIIDDFVIYWDIKVVDESNPDFTEFEVVIKNIENELEIVRSLGCCNSPIVWMMNPEYGVKKRATVQIFLRDLLWDKITVDVPATASKYFIQNKDAGWCGNNIIFWAKDSRGYTADLKKSEVFSRLDAMKICAGNPEKNVAWKVSDILYSKALNIGVDSQYLPKDIVEYFKL